MSDLREALETIAQGGVPIGISPAKWAEEWLAAHPAEETCNCGFGGVHDDANPRCDRNLATAHPVEPAAKSAREIARGVHERFAPLRESALHIPAAKPSKSEAPAPVKAKVPDEIVDIAVNAYLHDPGDDPVSSMRAALEAVAPRPLLDRDAVKLRLDTARGHRWSEDVTVDAVMELARPMPTEAEIGHALNLHWWDEDEHPCACSFDFIAAGQSFKMHLAAVFTALLNGTES